MWMVKSGGPAAKPNRSASPRFPVGGMEIHARDGNVMRVGESRPLPCTGEADAHGRSARKKEDGRAQLTVHIHDKIIASAPHPLQGLGHPDGSGPAAPDLAARLEEDFGDSRVPAHQSRTGWRDQPVDSTGR